MKFSALAFSALVALSSTQSWAQTSKLSTVGIVTGVVTVTDRVGTPTNRPGTVGNNLAGLAYVAGNVPAAVDTSISFFTLTGATVPPVPADAFTSYGTLISPTAVGSYPDVAGLLTGSSYSGLTFAIDDLGLPIAGTFYTIHHRPTGDYFANIVPRTGGNSSTADLKPMSWAGGVAGGPSDPGLSGYFGLVYATGAVTGYSANSMFYLRTAGGNTQFGEMIPALTSGSTDKINLSTAVGSFGVGGYTTLAYSPVAFGGYAANQFYYLRLDSVTGNTVLGRLDPSLVPGVRTISDIANLGGVFNALNYAFDATGPAGSWGLNQLYATGSRTATAQSISFAAIADRAISAGSFTVTPSASSNLVLALTVVSSSTGSASISGPVAGVFTVTPLSPGIVTLQATQSGGAFDSNMLRQSFNATGGAALVITTQPTAQSAVVGATVNFSVVASGTSTVSYQWRKGGFNILANASALTSTLTLTNVQAVDAASYDVVVTNLSGSVPSNAVTLTVTAVAVAPAITTQPTAQSAVTGSTATFTVAASGTGPLSYQWRKGGTNVVGNASATTATLTLPNVQAADAANYDVVVSNGTLPNATSNAVALTVNAPPAAPVITTQPTAQSAVTGATVNFTVAASGTTPLSYQWRKGGTNIAGNNTATTVTLTLTNAQAADAANYDVVVSNGTLPNATSNAVALTVNAAPAAPVITSPFTAAGTIGSPFSFMITATGSPLDYGASGLPPGLAINTLTGAITGTPTATGTTIAAITARNGGGSDAQTLTITIGGSGAAPIITNNSLIAAGTLGVPFNFAITATGSPTSYSSFNLPPGLVLNPLTGVVSGTPTSASTTFVTLTAINASGSASVTLMIVTGTATSIPIISSPVTATGVAGVPLVPYLIVATGLPTAYSATGLPPGLSVNPLTGAINGTSVVPGTYVVTLTATNASGSSTAVLTIVIAPSANYPASQIVNFAARAISGPGSESLIMGFVVAGNGTNLLVRGIGPGLTSYGVTNTLADPFLTLFNNAGAIATNDDWQTNTAGASNATLIASTAARVGAFALPAGSKDSALLLAINSGAHTTGLVRPNGTTGVALTEIYDVDRNPGTRLVNVSARMNVTTGEGTLIAGLVIVGSAPNTVLIRGIGPTLSAFGVTGVLADPTIAVFSGSTQIASNDNWEAGANTAPQMIAAAAQVGAFALQPGSKDAALLITLPPGNYTVQVTGVAGSTGVALVEVYDIP